MGTLYVGIATTDEADNATLRLQRLLGSVAVVVAENVNRTEGLLDRLGLTEPPVVPVHDADLPDALEKADVALLLDGWHLGPTSSGHDLVRSAIARGLPVVPVPGTSLPILALVASGLPSASFVYLGELPPEPADRQRLVEAIAGEARTLVFIANPAQLADLVPALGERPLVEASSSTRGASIERWPSLALAVGSLAGRTAQDQRVWLVGGLQEPAMTWTEERLRAEVGARVRSGFTAREIGPMLSLESGWPRRVIYRLAVEASRQPDGE